SPAMDAALQTHSSSDFPLAWFLICDHYEIVDPPYTAGEDFHIGAWEPSVSWDEYYDAMKKIKSHILDGDTYQVNYTLRLRTKFTGDPCHLFVALHKAQNPSYSAYVQLDGYDVCSVSPELFFSLQDGKITCKPMKGTVKRGLTNTEDAARSHWLHHSQK